MATIHDLIEVTGIASNTTYSAAAGNVIGVVDGVTSTDLDDGEFDEGDVVFIDGVPYTIDRIQEPSDPGRFILEDGTVRGFDSANESNLPVVFLTVSNGTDVRHFIIPNDSYGDMAIDEIRTGRISDVGGSDAAVISTSNNDVNVVCFVVGTLIETPGGPVAVEHIRVGDPVWTRNNGPQPVRAILTRALDLRCAPERLRPVAIEADALGPGRPNRRLCVSPQHRMLVTDRDGAAVLVPAKALLSRRGVRVMRGLRRVVYHHLVFSRHEIILANGALSESLLPGPVALGALDAEARAELNGIFGEGVKEDARLGLPAAAPILRFREAERQARSFV